MSRILSSLRRLPRASTRTSFLGLAVLAACGSSGGDAANVGPAPFGPSLAEVVGDYRAIEHPWDVALQTAGEAMFARQLINDAAGSYFKTTLGVTSSSTSLRAYAIGVGNSAPAATTSELARSDRAGLFALAVCVPTPTAGNAAACDVIVGTTPARAGMVQATRVGQPDGVFRASAILHEAPAHDWFLLDDRLGTVLQLDRSLRPVRAVRHDGLGLVDGAAPQPLLLGVDRAWVACGVRAADGALWHSVTAANGAVLRSFTLRGAVEQPIAIAFSDAIELAAGHYATRHFVQPVLGAARAVTCVFGPDHAPIAMAENGTVDALDLSADPGGTTFSSDPVLAAGNQWQPVRLTLTPSWPCTAAGLHGAIDAQGALLVSATTAGAGVLTCLAADWTERWSLELAGADWRVLAASPQCVLATGVADAPGTQWLVWLDRPSGVVLAAHRIAVAAGASLTAQFANDGIASMLAIQGADTTLVVAPGGIQPVRAFVVTAPKLGSVGDLSHDPATDLFTAPVVGGQTLFVRANALTSAASSLGCLTPATLDAAALGAVLRTTAVAVTPLASLPLQTRAADAAAPLVLDTSAAQLEILGRDIAPLPICR